MESQTTIPCSLSSIQEQSFHSWLLEIGPLALIMAFLWGKLVCFSISLCEVWETPEASTPWWIHSHLDIFSANLVSLVVLFWPLLLLPRIWRFIVLLLLNFFLTSVIVTDIVHVHFYGDVISFLSFSNATALRWVYPSVLEALRSIYAVYYCDIVVGVFVLPFYIHNCQRTPRLDRKYIRRLSVGLGVCSLLTAIPTVRMVWWNKNEIFTSTNLPRHISSAIGLLPYHFGDAVISLISSRRGIEEPERQRVRRFLDTERQKWDSPSRFWGVAHGRNVIIISAESLQTFVIGLQIYGQSVAPRLTTFAKESLYFENFYDQTYLGTTADGEFTSLQSLHPLPVGVVASHYATNHYHALPAILLRHGYTTLSAYGEPSEFWNMNIMHPRLGIQQSFAEERFQGRERIGPWIADKEFFAQTISILENQSEPFMGFLLSSTNHHPYLLPEKYRVLKLGDLEGTLLGAYLHTVHYFDQAFGEFIDQLQKNGLLEKSVIVLYGDHQGFLGQSPELVQLLKLPERSEYHRLLIKKKVPLMIRLPHREGAKGMNVTGGHLDIAPTLLSLLGFADESGVMLGRDLTREENALVVFRDGSFIDGTYYFHNRLGPIENSACYEVRTEQVIDCRLIEERQREALKRLEISDLIIRGDLIPYLSGGVGLNALHHQ